MKSIEVEGLRAFCEQALADGDAVTLLDVREPWEVALAPIALASVRTLAISMNDVPSRMAELDPAQPLVCLCHHGVRSAHVVNFLERNGFEAVVNLTGGSDAWSARVDPAVARY